METQWFMLFSLDHLRELKQRLSKEVVGMDVISHYNHMTGLRMISVSSVP